MVSLSRHNRWTEDSTFPVNIHNSIENALLKFIVVKIEK